MDQAGKSFGFMKEVSSLECQVTDLMVKIIHLEECDAFLIGIIESACEQLQCKFFLEPPSVFCCVFLVSYALISHSPGISLDPVAEDHRVSERVAALERVSLDTNTFGLMLVAAAPLFFYKTMFSMSENLLMVVENT
jgi:hypothetical protein